MIVQLTITMNEQGQISVNGPIDQMMLCYGLLGVAKDVIRRHNDEKSNRVIPAPFPLGKM